ncbi:MAG: tetratricopeptide repeat protein [Steroidobacteraceae bacterium]
MRVAVWQNHVSMAADPAGHRPMDRAAPRIEILNADHPIEATEVRARQLADAIDAWRRGLGAEAELLARAVAARDPDHVDAHRLLTEVLASADRRSEAIGAARRVIELAPRDAPAHRRLADLLSRGGDTAAAVAMLERSLELEPDNARALSNLGNLMTGQGRTGEAITLLTQAIARQPDYPAAWVNLGVALVRSGRLDEAIDSYRRALTLNPRFPEALLNLASAYGRAQKPSAALDCYEQARALRRPDADALTGCGEAYLVLKRYVEALASFDDALMLAADLRPARLGRIHALLGLKRPAAALAACDAILDGEAPPPGTRGLRATALLALDRVPDALRDANEAAVENPDDAQTFITLGFAALRSGTPEPALFAFDRATRLAPTIAKAHAGRANALEALGRATDAIDAYEEAARLDPTVPDVFLRSGLLMLNVGFGAAALAAFDAVLALDAAHLGAKEARAMALLALGRHEEASRAFIELDACAPGLDYLPGYVFNLKLWCCDWTDYESARGDIVARVGRGERADVPLSFLAHGADPAEQRSCAEIYVADKCAVGAADVARVARADRPRLRIAYLSYDLRDHPVAQLTAGLFEAHDRSRFEIYGLCAAADDNSGLRRRLRAAFDHFEDVSALPDKAIAERIAALDIDLLVDLGGHTLGSRTRVLAYRPAAVQIAFLGFPGTLGGAFVDYLVADRHVIPEEERIHYAEQVIYMPDTYLPFDFMRPLPPPPDRREAGLPDEALVFCCFNAPFKFTPAVFHGWMRVLQAVPAGVLWLREASAAVRRNLAREAAARGVDPKRLIYAARAPTTEDHLARFALADIFLDTTPYNAHTTAGEALAAGVPVITRRGRTFASRVATSLLHAVDLGHLSAETPTAYERLAIDLALSPATLAAAKAHLRRVRSSAPLFDTLRFCRHLEDAFVEAAARQRRAERPSPLHVERRSSGLP